MLNRRDFLLTTLATTAAGGLATPALAQATPLAIQLSWLPDSGSAGEIVALTQGLYSEAGLDVTLLPGGPGSNAIQELLSGTSDISIGYAPQIMYSANRGLPLKSFAASFQKAPLTFYSFKEAGIETVSDWAGRRIGAGQGAIPQIRALLANVGLTMDDITFVQSRIPGLLQDQVDVVASWPTNVAQLAPVLAHPGGVNTQTIWDNGLQFQSNYYIAKDETLANDAEMLKTFLEVTDTAWSWVADHREEAAAALVAYAPALDADLQLQSLNMSLDNYIYTDETLEFGWGNVSEARWQQTLDTYASIGEIESSLSAVDVFDGSILAATDRTKR
ncbi:hypothetical protein E2K80_12185 [Rhodophyticola sp. CCM32]|uniref:ABC transporter substrate-binding protein n=1 Tax=Rhodophyticola sp. CCM32 TaxID=2916397 RepID=UPI00107F23C6|nr:ABC transporter substrate-binding protein [Rhodophyticola sp. CCM32]QBY01390.1 hypothetical protein E2K80_12185 [Rhodophyticola sp. CCM32]